MWKKITEYFTRAEIILWSSSVVLITLFFCVFDRHNFLSLVASLLGTTALIFCAKGNPLGQFLMVIFGILYGIISWSYAYYGEMMTYLGMTVPMAIVSFVSWFRNPYKGKRSQVKVGKIKGWEISMLAVLTVAVTVAFYFILDTFGTANLLPSTVSVTTSFVAVYLTFRRSPYFALAYATNDVVLIILWVLATIEDSSYVSVIGCFMIFLLNDLYSFCNWRRMEKKQGENK